MLQLYIFAINIGKFHFSFNQLTMFSFYIYNYKICRFLYMYIEYVEYHFILGATCISDLSPVFVIKV